MYTWFIFIVLWQENWSLEFLNLWIFYACYLGGRCWVQRVPFALDDILLGNIRPTFCLSLLWSLIYGDIIIWTLKYEFIFIFVLYDFKSKNTFYRLQIFVNGLMLFWFWFIWDCKFNRQIADDLTGTLTLW